MHAKTVQEILKYILQNFVFNTILKYLEVVTYLLKTVLVVNKNPYSE